MSRWTVPVKSAPLAWMSSAFCGLSAVIFTSPAKSEATRPAGAGRAGGAPGGPIAVGRAWAARPAGARARQRAVRTLALREVREGLRQVLGVGVPEEHDVDAPAPVVGTSS